MNINCIFRPRWYLGPKNHSIIHSFICRVEELDISGRINKKKDEILIKE